MKKNNNIQLFCKIVFILLIGIVACKPRPENRVVEESWPSGREKTVRFYRENGDKKELSREILYYENGQKKQEGEYRNGERHGKWAHWYENGNLWSEGEFKNNLSHGYRKVYHPNGKLYYEGKFKDDKQTGTWKFYDEEGRFIKEETY